MEPTDGEWRQERAVAPRAGSPDASLDKDRREPARYEPGEGCLTTMVRLPVRIVVLVLVVPVRLVWDALVVCAKAVDRTVLRPFGRGLAWLWRTLVVAPLAWLWRYLVVVPAGWLWRGVLAPVGRALAWLARGLGLVLVWCGKALFVWPWVALWRYVVAPVGRGVAVAVAWLVRYLLVVPAEWLYAQILTPVGRGIAWLARTVGAASGRRGRVAWVWRWCGAARRCSCGRGWRCGGMCWRRSVVVSRSRWRGWCGICSWCLPSGCTRTSSRPSAAASPGWRAASPWWSPRSFGGS